MQIQKIEKNNAVSAHNMRLIELTKNYTEFLQTGDEEQARSVFLELCEMNASPQSTQNNHLYHEIGKLTRELHESINNFTDDSRMQTMMNEEMPDARQRLQHVMELTDRSAHKTMSLIEHSRPLISLLSERVLVMQSQLSSSGSDNEVMTGFFEFVSSISKKVSNDLNEIMLAQDYQDLTGQIIQRVSTLVQDVESSLISLLKLSDTAEIGGEINRCEKKQNLNPVEKDNKGYGPAVPGVSKGDVLQSQDEVDDLLSSLGF